MHDEDAVPEDIEATANQWLTDKIVSSVSGPDVLSGRDREAIRTSRDEAYLRLQFVRVYVRDQNVYAYCDPDLGLYCVLAGSVELTRYRALVFFVFR